MSHVWEYSPYDGSKLLLHLAMADSAHEDGGFFMSQALLAKKARCSIENVRLTVRDMEKRGLITIEQRGNSRKFATVYRLYECVELPKMEGGVSGSNNSPNLPNSPKQDPELPKSNGSHPSFTSVLSTNGDVEAITPPSAAQQAAQIWWTSLTSKPIGKNAWWSLLEVCKAAEARGYTIEQMVTALDYIGTVPTLRQFDLILRGRGVTAPRETTAVRVARQAIEAANRLEAEGL
jgi:hypothetical protein